MSGVSKSGNFDVFRLVNGEEIQETDTSCEFMDWIEGMIFSNLVVAFTSSDNETTAKLGEPKVFTLTCLKVYV